MIFEVLPSKILLQSQCAPVLDNNFVKYSHTVYLSCRLYEKEYIAYISLAVCSVHHSAKHHQFPLQLLFSVLLG